jgi:ribonuclease HI
MINHMAKKNKVYVVWKGNKTGIFSTWDECKAQVDGYAGARYKAFESRQQAEQAYKAGYDAYHDAAIATKPVQPRLPDEVETRRIGKPVADSYAVDAACGGNPGPVEYRCVHVSTCEEMFRQGPFQDGTNNIGEFLAIVHALALFKRKKITAPIYSDSTYAIKWVEDRECRTNLEKQESNTALFQLIERAVKWLLENDYENRVLKWHTEVWGEIPADYGRK